VAGVVFAATALLWMTGSGLDLGAFHVPSWPELLGLDGLGGDADTAALVAIAMGCLLFMVPSAERPGERLLEWSMARDVPWGMLLLFGGGFALASGFTDSGLSIWAAGRLGQLQGVSPWVMVVLVSVCLTLLTELTSNLATTQIFLPILAATASGLAIDPRLLMIPATLSASCAFMMPVATPPAAIVYASGHIPIRQMVRAGILFNILGVVLVVATMAALAGPVLGIDATVMPAWAQP
jgi:sodium-dependent dicarboxylate transporter 2/3/5